MMCQSSMIKKWFGVTDDIHMNYDFFFQRKKNILIFFQWDYSLLLILM